MSETARELMTLGDVVRHLRYRAALSAHEVASNAEISAQYLSDIEHGRRVPGRAARFRLAGVLCVSAEYLDYLAGEVPASIRGSVTGTDEQISRAWQAFVASLNADQDPAQCPGQTLNTS